MAKKTLIEIDGKALRKAIEERNMTLARASRKIDHTDVFIAQHTMDTGFNGLKEIDIFRIKRELEIEPSVYVPLFREKAEKEKPKPGKKKCWQICELLALRPVRLNKEDDGQIMFDTDPSHGSCAYADICKNAVDVYLRMIDDHDEQ